MSSNTESDYYILTPCFSIRFTFDAYVPIYEKSNLTLEEAAAYFNIGVNKLRQLTDDDKCPFVLWVGSKRLIKRKKMDEYLSKTFSV